MTGSPGAFRGLGRVPVSIFISTVTDKFRSYRDQLVHDLTPKDVAVKVQEDIEDHGHGTLDTLDRWIAE